MKRFGKSSGISSVLRNLNHVRHPSDTPRGGADSVGATGKIHEMNDGEVKHGQRVSGETTMININ